MTAERWSLIERIFEEAVERPPDERAPFLDQACNGDADEMALCKDSDGDGEPDTSDCAPMDPTVHHPQPDPQLPHYDPYPESANCCGYSLGRSGPDRNVSFDTDPTCHKATCGDNIDQD